MAIHLNFRNIKTLITSAPSVWYISSGLQGADSLPLKNTTVNYFFLKNLKFISILACLILCFSFVFNSEIFAQRKSDLGIFGGISWYQGDINSRPFYSPGVAVGPIYRYNFHRRTSVRLSSIYYQLSADDIHFQNEIQQLRGASFFANGLDLAAVWEHNFLQYQTAFDKTKYSPYVFAGLGFNLILSSDVNSSSHFTIPFGLGFKWNITKRLSGGIENSFHKTYTDKLDGVVNFSNDDKFYLFGNKDWYTFTGFFLTYKFFNFREECPAYD